MAVVVITAMETIGPGWSTHYPAGLAADELHDALEAVADDLMVDLHLEHD